MVVVVVVVGWGGAGAGAGQPWPFRSPRQGTARRRAHEANVAAGAGAGQPRLASAATTFRAFAVGPTTIALRLSMTLKCTGMGSMEPGDAWLFKIHSSVRPGGTVCSHAHVRPPYSYITMKSAHPAASGIIQESACERQ